jgi:hypothetical protein
MKLRSALALISVCAVPAFVSGCGSATNPAQSLPSLSEPASATAAKAKKRVRFVIHLPKRKAGRHGRYLSPATKSMRVSISLGGKSKVNTIVALTLGSKGCSGTGTTAQCVFVTTLPAAKGYVGSFTTYDGANGSGKILSAATNITFNVVKGNTSVVGLTLDGVPVGVEVYAAAGNAFYAVTIDTDANVIVGPGAPKITATGSGPAVATITQPTQGDSNTVRFTPNASVVGTETIGLTASYAAGTTNGCAVAGAVCTFPGVASLSNGQEVFVANYYGDAGSSIVGFVTPLSDTSTPAHTLTIDYPFPIAMGPSDRLFASQYTTSGSLYTYAYPYTAAPTVAAGLSDAEGLTVAADGNAFVIGGGYVDEYVPPYTGAPVKFTGASGYGIAVDSSDNVYVSSGSTMEVFSPPYTSASVPKYTVALSSTAEYPVVVSGSKVYVGEQSNVDAFTLPITSNSQLPSATITDTIDYAYGLALDSAGNLYVANYDGGAGSLGSVLVYDAPITTGEGASATINAAGYPQDLLLDKAGNLFVSTYEGGANGEGSIYEFKPPFSSASTPTATVSTGVYYPYGDGLAITNSTQFSMELNQ